MAKMAHLQWKSGPDDHTYCGPFFIESQVAERGIAGLVGTLNDLNSIILPYVSVDIKGEKFKPPSLQIFEYLISCQKPADEEKTVDD